MGAGPKIKQIIEFGPENSRVWGKGERKEGKNGKGKVKKHGKGKGEEREEGEAGGRREGRKGGRETKMRMGI